jgi:hypothetical protein
VKLLGRDISGKELVTRIEGRLRARGLEPEGARTAEVGAPEPRVDPISFALRALEEHADSARGLPLETHRGGVGRVVLLAKWAFRKSCQVFINETLGRQRLFNAHVRDSYAQLSAEVLRLKAEVEALKGGPGAKGSQKGAVRAGKRG